MKKLAIFLALTTALLAVDVTFTLEDHSWSNHNIMYKGTATDWAVVQMYDDGTNGDTTADDHIWTVVIDVTAGDHQWGAIDTDNGDGTVCEACDGTDGYGSWLIVGDNPAYSVSDGGDISGTTSYTIDAFTAPAEGTISFTVTDLSESYLDIQYKGTATNWEVIDMYDDGTNGDETADDHVWTVHVEGITAGDHEWGAIENDGSEYGIWLIQGPNPSYNLEEDLLTYHGNTHYVIAAPTGDSVMVTLTLHDGSWLLDDVMFKGTISNWAVFQAYDDGTNGDAVADDHIWTAEYMSANGDHQWGAIDTDNGDGTECEACDGSDGWGTWMIVGPNPEFSVGDGSYSGVTDYVIAPDSAVSEGSVMFTVHDGTEEWTDIMYKGTATDWGVVQMYDDGTNGDETADDHIWSVIVEGVTAGDHQWGAIDTDNGDGTNCEACDGSDGYGTWLIEGGNPEFNLEDDMLTLHGITDYEIIPQGGEEITKTVLFSVDMTEWLDEEGNLGMRAFNIGNGDEMQVRGSFNGWGNCTECTMTRTPGTNIFSHAIEVTGLTDAQQEYAFYMHLSEASVAALSENFNSESVVDWIGWETSPRDLGNRKFVLGEDDGTGLLELPQESYYDAFPGSVIPNGTSVDVTFSIDMTDNSVSDFNAAEDSVFIRTNDKWLNLSQGFSDGQDLNHYGAVSQGDGTYDFTVTFNGPMMWQVYYRWGFMDVSLGAEVEESGGGLGGHPRIRYIRQDPDADCAWPSSYSFQLDTVFATDEDLVNAEVWDVNGICLNYMDNDREASLPIQFTLSDNYPNPFNPTTQLDFSLPINSDISFRVFSIKGAEIYSYNETAVPAGNYKLTWAGKDRFGRSLPSGVYLYEFKAGDKFHKVKKMTLLK